MNPYEISTAVRSRALRPPSAGRQASREELFNEISYSQSDVERSFWSYGQNPDPIARTKGLKIYHEMMEDDQVKACVDLRKQARLSSPWTIAPAEDGDARSEELADFVRSCLQDLSGPFEDVLYEVYSAIEFGFSVSEKVYKVIEAGKYKGKIGLAAVKTREPFFYDFKCDEHGNLIGLTYYGLSDKFPKLTNQSNFPAGSIVSPSNGKLVADGTMDNPFPPEKFIIYSYNSTFGNPYGRSDLLSAFRSWLSKKHVMKFWNIWLERYAAPFIHAQTKAGSGLKKQVMDELDDFIKNLSVRTGFRSSDAVTLNPIQFSTSSSDAYERSIEAHNRYISHAILTPNLIGMTGSQGSGQGPGGTYALGKKHFEAFVWVLDKMGRDTSESIVGDQIIKPLVDLNFPNVDPEMYPRFKFESLEDESIEARSRIVTMLAQGGFMDPNEPWVRAFLTLPKFDKKATAKAEKVETPEEKSAKINGTVNGDEDKPKKPSEMELVQKVVQAPVEKPLEAKPFARAGARFEVKVMPREFAEELDSVENAMRQDLAAELESIRDSVLGIVEKRNIIENGNVKDVESVKADAGGLRDVIRNWMVKVHLDSKLRALVELSRAGVKVIVERRFQGIEAPMEPWEPLPPKQAIDFFNRKVIATVVTRDGVSKLIELAKKSELDYYDSKAFAVSGIVRDDILGDVKQAILSAIKKGDEAQGVKDIKDIFVKYIESGIEVDEELLSPSRLNTIVSTNVSDALNQGRRAMYDDPDVKGFVEYFQYSAVMDERTTDYCSCMDGKVFRIEDLASLVPPAHYNCRSITVPITMFELQELKEEGRGVEISSPCPDRMQGFERKGDFSVVQALPLAPPIPVAQPANQPPIAARPEESEERFWEELETVVSKCPYKLCHQAAVRRVKRMYNVGEFSCGACGMPFRVSNTGDVYLFDAGTDQWTRATIGLTPAFFSKK